MSANEPFDPLLWHDNALHAFRIEAGADGMGELVLDIDHIVEWLPPLPGTTTYRFRVAPAELRFHEASDLVVTLDYTAPRFALLPMTLHDTQRTPRTFPNGYRSFDWTMTLSCPHDGQIRFSAVGYSQRLLAPPVETDQPSLSPKRRPRCWQR